MAEHWVTRFFRRSDPHHDTVIVPLPATWWSRPYEYCWAEQFGVGDLEVLDAAAGISHPFKFWLAAHCAITHACDIDPRITDWHAMQHEIAEDLGEHALNLLQAADRSRLQLACASILDLPYPAQSMDRVFCLSVLEHLPQDEQIRALTEFRRVIKPDGLALITVDYPLVRPAFLHYALSVTHWMLAGPADFSLPLDGLTTPNSALYCFRAVLQPAPDSRSR